MDLQEIFNKVSVHLLTQNAKAHEVLNDGTLKCRYRTDAGLMCAAGCLILDHVYTPAIEGYPCSTQKVIRVLAKSGVLEEEGMYLAENREKLALLVHLQNIHDTSEPEDWRDLLMATTSVFDLDDTLISGR